MVGAVTHWDICQREFEETQENVFLKQWNKHTHFTVSSILTTVGLVQ